jgi:hypothetical protein
LVGGATDDLASKMHDDLGMKLPASAVVEHGTRIAYRDPLYYYIVQMSPQDVPPFIDQLRTSGTQRNWNFQNRAEYQMLLRPPEWFTPSKETDLVIFDMQPQNFPPFCWRIGYSQRSGRIYIEYITF